MNKSETRFEGLKEKRMLSVEEAAFYTGVGKTTMYALGKEIGAIRKIGRRAVYDRLVIDQYLNSLTL